MPTDPNMPAPLDYETPPPTPPDDDPDDPIRSKAGGGYYDDESCDRGGPETSALLGVLVLVLCGLLIVCIYVMKMK